MAILLFAGQHYYPSGGCYDLKGVYSTLEEAKKEGKRLINARKYVNEYCDWYNIMDGDSGNTLHSEYGE